MRRVRAVVSEPDPDDLSSVLTEVWGLGSPRCRVLQHSVNDTFLVESDSAPVIARVYGVERGGVDDVAFELAWCTSAADAGVRVARPVPSLDGSPSMLVAMPEGQRVLAVFERADGAMPSPGDAGALGGELGRLHAHGDVVVGLPQRRSLDLEYLVRSRVGAAAELLSDRPSVASSFHAWADKILTDAEAATAAALDWGPCHGDATLGNAVIGGDGATLIDLEFAGPGWRAYDLATFRWSLGFVECDRERVWANFIDAYRGVRPIGDVDLRSVTLFEAIRTIWLLGHWARAERSRPVWRHFSERSLDAVLALCPL